MSIFIWRQFNSRMTPRIIGAAILLLFLSQGMILLPGGPRSILPERLQSQEIRELVETAVNSSSPCYELIEILNGTGHIVNGVKYHFKVRVARRNTCHDHHRAKSLANLSIYIPASANGELVYSLD